MEFTITREEILRHAQSNADNRKILESIFPKAFDREPIFKRGSYFAMRPLESSDRSWDIYVLSITNHKAHGNEIMLTNIMTGFVYYSNRLEIDIDGISLYDLKRIVGNVGEMNIVYITKPPSIIQWEHLSDYLIDHMKNIRPNLISF